MSAAFAAFVLYLIAAACFLLAVFKVSFVVGLVELGLLCIALGLVASTGRPWRQAP